MLHLSSSDNSPDGELSDAALEIDGTTTYMFVWIPTARNLRLLPIAGPSDPAPPIATWFNFLNNREKSTVWWNLVTEKMTLYVSGGIPWRWRRIAFTFKGPLFLNVAGVDESNWFYYFGGYEMGYRRPWFGGDFNITRFSSIRDTIFRGTVGIDWASPFDAALETRHISVKMDHTITLSPANEVGKGITLKKVHHMKHNLNYGDFEVGGQMVSSTFSTNGKPGMGDYYIVDIFAPYTLDAESTLSVSTQATGYWHER